MPREAGEAQRGWIRWHLRPREKGRAISRCGSAGSAHHGDSFGVVWSLVGRKRTK